MNATADPKTQALEMKRLAEEAEFEPAKTYGHVPEGLALVAAAQGMPLATPRKPQPTRDRFIHLPKDEPPPRNSSCPCGSGRKYKKCCGGQKAVRHT